MMPRRVSFCPESVHFEMCLWRGVLTIDGWLYAASGCLDRVVICVDACVLPVMPPCDDTDARGLRPSFRQMVYV